MARRIVVALVALVAAAHKKTPPPPFNASDALARVRAVDRWLDGGGPAPAHWAVTTKYDVAARWKKLGGGNSKEVYATRLGADGEGAKVVVKTKVKGATDDVKREADVRAELLFLESRAPAFRPIFFSRRTGGRRRYLAGEAGVPTLHGGWLSDARKRVSSPSAGVSPEERRRPDGVRKYI